MHKEISINKYSIKAFPYSYLPYEGHLMTVNVGDMVRIVCKDRAVINKSDETKTVEGIVESVFNAVSPDGDNWIYEIRGKNGEWFLYKQKIDGGTITVLRTAK